MLFHSNSCTDMSNVYKCFHLCSLANEIVKPSFRNRIRNFIEADTTITIDFNVAEAKCFISKISNNLLVREFPSIQRIQFRTLNSILINFVCMNDFVYFQKYSIGHIHQSVLSNANWQCKNVGLFSRQINLRSNLASVDV